MLIGLVETAAWFFAYLGMNGSGEPNCCPVRRDIKFAIVASVAKETLSRVLLLYVCLGAGVVRETLERAQSTGVAALYSNRRAARSFCCRVANGERQSVRRCGRR